MVETLNKIKEFARNNKLYIGTYILFFIICVLTPISGDDYMNYVRGKNGLLEILNITKEFYLTWEGRVASRIIILLFTPRKFLWNIITPLLFVVILKSFIKNDVLKNKDSYFLLLIAIMSVSTNMFAQTYTWLAGNITYFYPTALTIFYFITLYNNIDNKLQIRQIILLSVLSLIIPMFTENIGCSFVFGNILFVIYRLYLKKDIKNNLCFCILSIFSLMLMLLSPGSAIRASEEGVVIHNLLEKIVYNILWYFPRYTFTRHISMIILMITCCNIYIFKKANYKKTKKIIVGILFNSISIINLIQNLLNIESIISQLSVIFICYYFILSLISSYKEDKKLFLFYILLLLLALSSTLCMIVVGYWFDRVSILFVMVIYLISVEIIDKNTKMNNLRINLIIKIIFMIVVFWFILCMFCTYKIDKYRIKLTSEQKEIGNECIEVIRHPLPYIWLSNLNHQYFVDTYKQYQGIDNETNLILKKLSLEEYVRIIFGK